MEFEKNKDILPNLRWMPTTSPNPEKTHEEFWKMKLTRPIGDKFWDEHMPGDHWNCKCSLEQTDDPATTLPTDEEMKRDEPQAGLKGNPAKTGQLFDESHPYFPTSCKKCGFNKQNLIITNVFRNTNRNCKNCTILTNAVNRTNAQQLVDVILVNHRPQRIAHHIASFSRKEINKIKNLALILDVKIYISDDRIQHALRESKVNAGRGVSSDDIKHFIKNIDFYDMYFDTTKHNIVYAVSRDERSMKFIIKPNSKVKINKKKIPANTFVTAGIVQPYNLQESHLIKIR